MPQKEPTLHDYWQVLKRRKLIIIFTFCAVVFFTGLFTQMAEPVFQAIVTVKIEQQMSNAALMGGWFAWSSGDPVSSEISIINSREVVEEVIYRLLGLSPSPDSSRRISSAVSELQGRISTEKIGDSNLVKVSVTSGDSQKAVEQVNMLSSVYQAKSMEKKNKRAQDLRKFIEEQLSLVSTRLHQAENNLKAFQEKNKATGIRDTLIAKMVDCRFQLEGLLRQYTSRHPKVIELTDQIAQIEKQLQELPDFDIELGRLMREIKVNEEQYDLLNTKYKEALIAEADKIQTVSIVDPAVQARQIAPNPRLNLSVAAICGILLGFLFAFIAENLDASVSRVEEIEEMLKLPVLGFIPRIVSSQRKWNSWRSLFTRTDWVERVRNNLVTNPMSTALEPYRALAGQIKLATLKQKQKFLLITSTKPLEGKSLTTANLGLVLAEEGKKALLIEADLRRPMLDRIFHVESRPGLVEVLSGDIPLTAAIKNPAPNLSLLTGGKHPPNPLELFESEEMSQLLRMCRETYDVVLFDSPPLISVPDTFGLASKIDGIILIYRHGKVTRPGLQRVVQQLEKTNTKILGVVVNDVRKSQMAGGSDYYYYHYRYRDSERRSG